MVGKPVLVAGKSGQLAQCLRASAAFREISMVTLGRPDLDIASGEGIDHAIDEVGPSVIVNAAAYTGVDLAEAEPERAFLTNCGGAGLLANAAARHGIPFIQVSTDYVFDGHKRRPYREDDVPAPLNVYGSSKLAGEAAVLEACPWTAVIRTSWVYSPYGQNFVRTMLRLSDTQPVVRVVSDQRGSPTSAADLADAILVIAERLGSVNGRNDAGIYHLTGEGDTSWYEFAGAILESLARRGRRVPELQAITTAEYPTPARRPRNSRLDSSKVERTFGVRLPQWRASLETCLDQLESLKELSVC
jgi:dTDP-4-dehydrorhamnose reductase